MWLRRSRWAFGLVLCAALVAACGGGGSAGDPATKSFVMLAQSQPPRGLDPAGANGGIIDLQYMQVVYGLLMYQDDSGRMQPGMAESMTPNADFSQWTLKLRPGVTFSDGTPFDAAAVAAHWKRMSDPATASPARAPLLEIASTTVVDATTLQVLLKQPRGTWDQTLATPVGAVPSPTAVQAAGQEYGTTAQTIVGAGPFVATEIQKGARYLFSRNPTYFDAPKPGLNTLEIRPMLDVTSQTNTFRSGGADLMSDYLATAELVALRQAGFPTASAASVGVAGLALRTDQGPTADVRVREALQRAIDIDSVLTRAAPGAERADTTMDPDGPWANDVKYPSYDPVRAQQLIDSYMAETGVNSVETTLIGANVTSKIWESFKQDWDKIRGLNVTLQIETTPATSARIAKRDYSSMLNASLSETPVQALSTMLSGSPQNLAFLNDPQLDRALRDANATNDVAAQKAAMKRVSERVSALVPLVAQYRAPFNWFWHKDVQGVSLSLTTGVIRFEDVGKQRPRT